MDALLLEEFKAVNEKWLLFGEITRSLNNEFNEVSDRFTQALEMATPFEFFDGATYHRVEKLGGFAGQGFYFSSDQEKDGCDRFAPWESIKSIASVREG